MDSKSQGEIGEQKDERKRDGESKGGWSVALVTLIVTTINGGIAFYGWNAAKSIAEYEATAKAKLNAIQQVVESGLHSLRESSRTGIHRPRRQ